MSERQRGAPLVLAEGVRTPFVRSFGSFLEVTVDDLLRAVFVEVVARVAIDPSTFDEVIVGCAGQPVEAMNVGRVAALRAGVPDHVPGVTVHRNCASGIEAIAGALRRLRAGDGEAFLVGGADVMSAAPFQLRPAGARKLVRLFGAKGFAQRFAALRRLRPRDVIPRETLRAALTDPVTGLLMGDTAEVLAREYDISREEQDGYAAESQQRAVAARDGGRFREESMPILVPPRFERVVESDDGIREDSTPERLARLKPVFDRRFGTVTVGNACQVTDGAAAMVLLSEERADSAGARELARVVDVVQVGCAPRRMGLGPAYAIPKLLARNGLEASQIGLHEINEAFAVQVLACLREMGDRAPPRDRLNVNGGAIALGHPVGASGVRIVLTLAKEMRRRAVRFGVASLCVGGGQGAAVLLENREADQ